MAHHGKEAQVKMRLIGHELEDVSSFWDTQVNKFHISTGRRVSGK